MPAKAACFQIVIRSWRAGAGDGPGGRRFYRHLIVWDDATFSAIRTPPVGLFRRLAVVTRAESLTVGAACARGRLADERKGGRPG